MHAYMYKEGTCTIHSLTCTGGSQGRLRQVIPSPIKDAVFSNRARHQATNATTLPQQEDNSHTMGGFTLHHNEQLMYPSGQN